MELVGRNHCQKTKNVIYLNEDNFRLSVLKDASGDTYTLNLLTHVLIIR